MATKLTTDDFIKKSISIHGDKYDYNKVIYNGYMNKVEIICEEHGLFKQTPNAHIGLSQGCPKCSNRYNYTTKEFIKNAKEIHGNKYDYNLVKYKNNFTKIKIICKKHKHIFEQKPNNHIIQKQGCPKCNGTVKRTNDVFIKDSIKVHGDRYDYSLVDYINNNTKVKILCKEHGEFSQSAKCHINRSQGCPKCRKSKCEETILKTLKDNNIKYITQKKFDGCKDKNTLPFDFYLPEYNMCIEYDGIQHFEPIEYWGGLKNFEYIQKHDKIKNKYCKKHNIKLIRIEYNRKLNSKKILKKIEKYETK